MKLFPGYVHMAEVSVTGHTKGTGLFLHALSGSTNSPSEFLLGHSHNSEVSQPSIGAVLAVLEGTDSGYLTAPTTDSSNFYVYVCKSLECICVLVLIHECTYVCG